MTELDNRLDRLERAEFSADLVARALHQYRTLGTLPTSTRLAHRILNLDADLRAAVEAMGLTVPAPPGVESVDTTEWGG